MSIGVLLLAWSGFASATIINFISADSATQKTSIYTYFDNFKLETFDQASMINVGLDQPWTWTGSGQIVEDTLSGKYAAPYGTTGADETKYLSVPNPNSTGTVTASLGATYDYFGVWWGSRDNYNTISFYNGTTLVESFAGTDVYGWADGNQTAPPSNVYVNFLGLGKFDSFSLTSTQFAFEVDNIAVGTTPVPEPATLLLFGTGLVGLVAARKRKKRC